VRQRERETRFNKAAEDQEARESIWKACCELKGAQRWESSMNRGEIWRDYSIPEARLAAGRSRGLTAVTFSRVEFSNGFGAVRTLLEAANDDEASTDQRLSDLAAATRTIAVLTWMPADRLERSSDASRGRPSMIATLYDAVRCAEGFRGSVYRLLGNSDRHTAESLEQVFRRAEEDLPSLSTLVEREVTVLLTRRIFAVWEDLMRPCELRRA